MATYACFNFAKAYILFFHLFPNNFLFFVITLHFFYFSEIEIWTVVPNTNYFKPLSMICLLNNMLNVILSDLLERYLIKKSTQHCPVYIGGMCQKLYSVTWN